jgi:FG-GAP-like repeat
LISLLRGAGDGTFQDGVAFQSDLYVGDYLAVGDFNNDGKLDLLLGTSADFSGVNVFLQGSH